MTRSRDTANTQDNIGGAVPPFTAGKNAIINGDFGVWQRGTSFSNPVDLSYTADRWQIQHDGTGATRTVTQQTFTPGTAPVAGYEGQYFYRYAVSVAGSGNTYQQFQYNQENVRTFAGQTITLSFWAKADASRTLTLLYRTDYGTGGSSPNQFSVGTGSVTLTTSWVRYSVTYLVPSVSGLTIGANSSGRWIFRPPAATTQTIDIWGVQVEAGSVATPFQTATGTIQGELAACQRYFIAILADGVNQGASPITNFGIAYSTTNAQMPISLPVQMRTAPSLSVSSVTGFRIYDTVNAAGTTNAVALASVASQPLSVVVSASVASGLTQYRPYYLIPGASATNYIYISAEL